MVTICDGSLLVVAASHVERLCCAFLEEQIDEAELCYIATALELGSDFQFVSKEVQECTFFLSRPETSGVRLAEIVPTVVRALREHAA